MDVTTSKRPNLHVRCFDPGVMPGTGLGRQHPAVVRALWSTVLEGARVLPFAASPAASGRALAALLCDDLPPAPTGSYVDHRLRVRPGSAPARDTGYRTPSCCRAVDCSQAAGVPVGVVPSSTKEWAGCRRWVGSLRGVLSVTLLEGIVAGLVIATLTAPVGVSGAVFLLPIQLDVLHVANPA